MFGASCGRNCGNWEDCGGLMGRCTNEDSEFFNSPTRYDFSCPHHPLAIRMLKQTKGTI